ncbi:MAG: FAD-binding oxidoreductase, partial [Solirubrobacteraceae bacterium]
MAAMKWWGWGQEGVEFTHEDKPALAPFILESIGVDVRRKGTPPLRFDQLEIPDPALPDDLWEALEQAVSRRYVSLDPLDRVVHARGKSLRDLVWQRAGDLPRIPDAVVRPGSEDEVTAILQAAMRFDAVVIPFGGGSSISGSLEAPPAETRPVISVDLERLNQVLEIDATSRLARVQAGVFGPHLEEQLAARGYTFGHF